MKKNKNFANKLKHLFHILGPGFITGAADDDPTAIATYAQSGAQFGYSQLWTTIFTIPFIVVVQEMSARIGLVTGKGLTSLLRSYHPAIVYVIAILLGLVNLVTLGADIGAMAATGQLLFPLPFFILIFVFVISSIFLQVFISFKKYEKFLKYTALALFAYIIDALITKQDWPATLKYTLFPFITLQKKYLLNLLAILGGNISPYLFFWQEGQELEKEKGAHKSISYEVEYMRIDTLIGMIFSNVIVYFIEISTAGTLHIHGITTVTTASQAAEVLRPLAGNFTFFLFAIGIIGSGFLAIPALSTSSAYVVSSAFHRKSGLLKTFPKAPFFYWYIILFTILASFINFLPLPSFTLLVYAAALNGVLTPLLLIFILFIANNKTLMGNFVNTPFQNVLSIGIICFTTSIVGVLLYFLL